MNIWSGNINLRMRRLIIPSIWIVAEAENDSNLWLYNLNQIVNYKL